MCQLGLRFLGWTPAEPGTGWAEKQICQPCMQHNNLAISAIWIVL